MGFNMQHSGLTPDGENNPPELPEIAVSLKAKQSSETHQQVKQRERPRKKEKRAIYLQLHLY